MKCIIIDDEAISRTLLADLIHKIPELDLIKSFEKPTEAIPFLKSTKIDIVFLDIEMPEINGIEFINMLQHLLPKVILTTSHEKFAVEAFQLDVSGYLVKPIKFEQFYNAVSRILKNNSIGSKNEDENLFIKHNGSIAKIHLVDINYVESLGDYITIHTDQKKYVIHSTMKDFEDKLPQNKFLRVHRSFIVQIDKIETIEDNTVSYKEKLIPIGKSYKQQVFKRLNLK